jgi:hypothetical protein
MIEQLLHCAENTIPIQRIGVLVASNDKESPFESAAHALIIIDRSSSASAANIARPKADLVKIASAVAVFRSIKDRRCRMAYEEVDNLVTNLDWDIPVTF